MTFAQAAISYRQSEKADRFLSKVEDHWRDTLVRDISPGAVRQAAIKLYPRGKAATRNRQAITPTQAIINHAASMQWCAPIKVERFPEDRKLKDPVSLQWAEAFAAHASPHLGALCLFMFGTGARLGEATSLTWAAVDLASATAIINQTKVGSERKAHLPPRLVAALANIPSNRNPGEQVFQYVEGGNVKQVWENVIKRAGIARLTPHSCRHGFATFMLRAGYDVKTVAKMGGWKDVATVLKYYAQAMADPTVTDALFDTQLTQADASMIATTGNKRIISA